MKRRDFAAFGLASGLALTLSPRPGQAGGNPMPGELRKAIERPPFAPVLGNAAGDITLTEFFDYNCPHCRTTVPEIRKLAWLARSCIFGLLREQSPYISLV